MEDENDSVAALEELQRDLGPEQTAMLERHANNFIGPILRMGVGGRLVLGYIAIKIAVMMESWQ